jgi:hypothetical protein
VYRSARAASKRLGRDGARTSISSSDAAHAHIGPTHRALTAEIEPEAIAAPSRRKWVGYALALIVAGLLVYAVVVAAGGISDALEQLRHATRIWLIPALVLEFLSYSFAGWLLRLLRGEHGSGGRRRCGSRS